MEHFIAEPEFRLDLSGRIGLSSVILNRFSPVNSDTFKSRGETRITARRWIQFLDGAEIILDGYMEETGRVKIRELAKRKYGFDVETCDDPVAYIQKLSANQEYKKELKGAPKKNEPIYGFSLPQHKKIFVKNGIDEGQRSFAIAHELSHYLLAHKGSVFYKTSGEFKKLHEKKQYNEEADKLAAILLMPHVYMQDLLNTPDEELAVKFCVPIEAVKKRKKEVKQEIFDFGYSPAPLEER
jgi:hypothetical protein